MNNTQRTANDHHDYVIIDRSALDVYAEGTAGIAEANWRAVGWPSQRPKQQQDNVTAIISHTIIRIEKIIVRRGDNRKLAAVEWTAVCLCRVVVAVCRSTRKAVLGLIDGSHDLYIAHN